MTEKEKVLVDIILTGAEDLELCPPNFGIATKCGPYIITVAIVGRVH